MKRTIRDLKFTNLPGGREGYESVPDLDTSGGYEENFPDGGSFSVLEPDLEPVIADTYEQQITNEQDHRNSFKEAVFEQIGGNPFEMSGQKALDDFRKGGGYERLFNYIFQGQLSWIDRRHMTPEQKVIWNNELKGHRADIVQDIETKKKQALSEYKYMMGEFDKQAGAISAAKQKDRKVVLDKKAKLVKAEQAKKTAALKKAQKAREDADTVTLAEKKAFQDQMKDYDPDNNVFSKLDKKSGEWLAVPKTALDIEILNETARLAGKGEFIPITRTVEGEKGWISFFDDPDTEVDEFFQLPVINDSNINEIIKAAQKVLDITKEDPEAGKELQDAFNAKVKDGMTPAGVAALTEKMSKFNLGEEIRPDELDGEATVSDTSSLVEEFRSVQESGDAELKSNFSDKINKLPEEKRLEFMSKLKKKEPKSRGSVKMGGVTKSVTPRGTTTTTAKPGTPETDAEKRRKGFKQRKKQRVGRRERSLENAQ